MSKIEAIKHEITALQDGESFVGVMTIAEARMAVDGILTMTNDRNFELHQEGGQIKITCRFSKKSKKVDRVTLWVSAAIIGCIVLHYYVNYQWIPLP